MLRIDGHIIGAVLLRASTSSLEIVTIVQDGKPGGMFVIEARMNGQAGKLGFHLNGRDGKGTSKFRIPLEKKSKEVKVELRFHDLAEGKVKYFTFPVRVSQS